MMKIKVSRGTMTVNNNEWKILKDFFWKDKSPDWYNRDTRIANLDGLRPTIILQVIKKKGVFAS